MPKNKDDGHYGNYQFTLTLLGYGECEDDAWEDAIEGFTCDPGNCEEGWEFVPMCKHCQSEDRLPDNNYCQNCVEQYEQDEDEKVSEEMNA